MSSPHNEPKGRIAHCDICNSDVLAGVNAEGVFVLPGILVASSFPPKSPPAFVASCAKCDLDVCARCANWDSAPSATASRAAALFGTRPEQVPKEILRQACYPICPRCSGDLSSKSLMDVNRIQAFAKGFSEATRAQTREAAPRLLRICQEQEAVLNKAFGAEVVKEIRKMLTEALSQ